MPISFRSFSLQALGTLLALALPMHSAVASQTVSNTLHFQQYDRTYELHVPDSVNTSHAVPLVLVFHGLGGGGRHIIETANWVEKSDAEGFILVAPDGVAKDPDRPASFRDNRRSWNSGGAIGSAAQHMGVDDIGFTRKLIDTITSKYSVDPNRIFAVGFSNGAAMTFSVGAELSDRIAAIAPVSNALLTSPTSLSAPVSLMMIWGLADPLNPINGGQVTRMGETIDRPSADDSLRTWGKLLKCDSNLSTEQPGAKLTVEAYRHCPQGSEAVLVKIAGLGHQWPGSKAEYRQGGGGGGGEISGYDATSAIWSFFVAHPRKGGSP